MSEYRVPVKVRHEMQADPRWELGLVRISELDELVKAVGMWGFYDGEDTMTEASGQFVGGLYQGSQAYFEIVLHEHEANS